MKLEFYGKEFEIVPNNNQEKVETLKMLAMQEGEIQLNKYGLNDWAIVFMQLGNRFFGVCCYNIKAIAINTITFEILDYGDIRDVILHEVAHAIVGPEHGHDEIWKAKALEIGGEGLIEWRVKKLTKVEEDKYRAIF